VVIWRFCCQVFLICSRRAVSWGVGMQSSGWGVGQMVYGTAV
jgi:hypothetical protein